MDYPLTKKEQEQLSLHVKYNPNLTLVLPQHEQNKLTKTQLKALNEFRLQFWSENYRALTIEQTIESCIIDHNININLIIANMTDDRLDTYNKVLTIFAKLAAKYTAAQTDYDMDNTTSIEQKSNMTKKVNATSKNHKDYSGLTFRTNPFEFDINMYHPSAGTLLYQQSIDRDFKGMIKLLTEYEALGHYYNYASKGDIIQYPLYVVTSEANAVNCNESDRDEILTLIRLMMDNGAFYEKNGKPLVGYYSDEVFKESALDVAKRRNIDWMVKYFTNDYPTLCKKRKNMIENILMKKYGLIQDIVQLVIDCTYWSDKYFPCVDIPD